MNMKKIRCFVAGAKDQERQREILTSVLGNMQTKWNVMFETKSFVDFNGTLSSDGQQKDYNKYIMSKADIVVFVFDHNVGEKTIEEFVVAYKGLLSRNHPDILVFCNSAVKNDLNIQAMSLMLNQLKQYYIEYSTDKDLKHLFSEEIDKYIKRKKDKTFTEWLICDFMRSNRYVKTKNSLILVLGLLLFVSIGYNISKSISQKSSTIGELQKQTSEISVYDGCRIISSKTIKTTNNIVRIEMISENVYRYLSWNISRGVNGKKEPSLVILDGEYKNGYFRFKKGTYSYMVPDSGNNQLLIMEGEKVLGCEEVVDFNYKGIIEQAQIVLMK